MYFITRPWFCQHLFAIIFILFDRTRFLRVCTAFFTGFFPRPSPRFLPAACTRTDETPVYLDGSENRAQTSAAILALQIKRLISVDFALPLKGFDYTGYEAWPIRGSMALTAAGQEALDSLDIQGCGE